MAIAKEVGFAPPVLVNVSPISIDTPELQKIVGQYIITSARSCIPQTPVLEITFPTNYSKIPVSIAMQSSIVLHTQYVIPVSLCKAVMKSFFR